MWTVSAFFGLYKNVWRDFPVAGGKDALVLKTSWGPTTGKTSQQNWAISDALNPHFEKQREGGPERERAITGVLSRSC